AIALAWLVYRRDLVRCLREPVLRSPVLVFESDDWSPGEADQAQALAAIAAVLRRFRDRGGRHPKFALGVILAVPAVEAAADPGAYRRVTLADARMSSLRDVLRQGVEDGVFSLQLHGMEHFWPPAVLARAAVDPKVAQWLREGRFPQSEALPSELQSRWADA